MRKEVGMKKDGERRVSENENGGYQSERRVKMRRQGEN
jgi:hypothetical protein